MRRLPWLFQPQGDQEMTLLVLLFAVLLLTLAALPSWPYSARWTYYPSGTLGLIALTIVMLVITGRL